MKVYYNEFDPKAAAWLRELMKDKLIPEGEVDERPIQQVEPGDVRDFDQCHFFAGIGGWPYALDLAGWGEQPVWTGSCPCQPFSNAGKRKGQADERHLWPMFLRLIRECNPATVFGEQVASDDGYRWLARVRDDLEEAGYAVGCADLPACCAGAPHIRQRLFWVGDSTGTRLQGRQDARADRNDAAEQQGGRAESERTSDVGGVADANSGRCGKCEEFRGDSEIRQSAPLGNNTDRCGRTDGLADSDGRESRDGGLQRSGEQRLQPQNGGTGGMADTECDGRRCDEHRTRQEGRTSPWRFAQKILCADGKTRVIEPSIFPLADGVPGRVGLLRGAGNAIVPQTAAKFIKAYLEAKEEIT